MADATNGSSTEEDPKLWRSGDPYQYPIPAPNGDPWEVVLDALLKKDTVQCEAWKDEVQNLLIFAGLFSAVVTAFVVESCKSLRPDSTDFSAILLARIAERLDSMNNTTSSAQQQSFPFDPSLSTAPSSSTVRVNIFWFLSLVLSLTTVLVGIVSLQWLREHQRYSDSLAPKQAVGIFHMRAQALEEWHVPRIFASLPLLLQVALILFFAGIIDFLLSLSHLVAAPVAVVLGIPILFIVFTTILPTIQCFSVAIRLPSSNAKIPSPCSYKSPQSLAFRRLATASRRSFMFAVDVVVRLLFVVEVEFSTFPHLFAYRGWKSQAWRYRLLPHRVYWFWAHRDWVNFDRTWLILRNEHFDITRKKLSGEVTSQPVTTEPVYDTVRGIASAAMGNEYREAVTFAVYHCFQDLAQSVTSEDDDHPNHHLQACYRDLVPTWNSPIANIASVLLNPPPELLRDVHSVLFLRLPGILYKAINPSHIFGKHLLELHTRILVHLYAEQPRKLVDGTIPTPTGFFHWYTINIAEAEDAFLDQFYILFASVVKTASTIFDPEVVLNTFHTHPDLDEFISLASFLTWYTADRTPEGDGRLSTLLTTLDDIESVLNTSISSRNIDSKPRIGPDFLFSCTTLYLTRIWQERISTPRVRAHRNQELFARLIQRFDHLHKEVLLPYEKTIDKDSFSKAYSRIVPANAFASNFFSPTGRDFASYGVSSGVLPAVSSRIEKDKLSGDHRRHRHLSVATSVSDTKKVDTGEDRALVTVLYDPARQDSLLLQDTPTALNRGDRSLPTSPPHEYQQQGPVFNPNASDSV